MMTVGTRLRRSAFGVLAVTFAVTVAACGGDSASVPGGPRSASSQDDQSSTAAESPGSQPFEVRLSGTGYSYALPPDWQDLTSAVVDTATPSADTVSGSGELLQSASALLIVRASPVGETADLKADRAALRVDLRESFTSQLDGPIKNAAARTIDGIPALGLRVRLSVSDDVSISAIYRVVRLDDTLYQLEAVTRAEEELSAKSFKEIFQSWSWDA